MLGGIDGRVKEDLLEECHYLLGSRDGGGVKAEDWLEECRHLLGGGDGGGKEDGCKKAEDWLETGHGRHQPL